MPCEHFQKAAEKESPTRNQEKRCKLQKVVYKPAERFGVEWAIARMKRKRVAREERCVGARADQRRRTDRRFDVVEASRDGLEAWLRAYRVVSLHRWID